MYRVWQFVRALMTRVQREDWTLLEGLLTPLPVGALSLHVPARPASWTRLGARLQRQRHRDRALLQAALLHDVGKAGHLHLWHRVAVVLEERFAPAMLRRLADDRPGSLGYPFFAHLNHSQLGAERAREAGCDGLTVELIQLHHEPLSSAGESEADRLLAALQAADGQV